MKLIDTNIFLELFLGQKKAAECGAFLQKVADGGDRAVVTSFTLHACEALLGKPKLISEFIRNIVNSSGLTVYETTRDDELSVSLLMEHVSLDFDDALQYFVCKKLGINFIVSFDRDFNGLDIKRIEPTKS